MVELSDNYFERVEFLKSRKTGVSLLKIGKHNGKFDGYLFKLVAFAQGKYVEGISTNDFIERLKIEEIPLAYIPKLIVIRNESEDKELIHLINSILEYHFKNEKEIEEVTEEIPDVEPEMEYINGYFMTDSNVVIKVANIQAMDLQENGSYDVILDSLRTKIRLTDKEFMFLKNILKNELKQEKEEL